jgi:hypothetical protein
MVPLSLEIDHYNLQATGKKASSDILELASLFNRPGNIVPGGHIGEGCCSHGSHDKISLCGMPSNQK